MNTGRNTKLTGAVGEFLVAAELCRRGLIATPFSGNVPYYDIVASDELGGHMVIQVKAINQSTWQFDAKKFAEITMEGDRQIIGKTIDAPFSNLYCVFVALGDSFRDDKYFIFSWKELSKVVLDHHAAYLEKHDGIRPKAPESTHCSISISELKKYENRWDKLAAAVVESRPG